MRRIITFGNFCRVLKMKSLSWFAMILFIGIYFLPSVSAVITITGNEEPLINGVQQDLTCTYSGQSVVSGMQWLYVIGPLEIEHISNMSGTRELVWSLTPTMELNGSRFKCRVLHPNNRRSDRTITITITDLQHGLRITASRHNPVALGANLTLTCVAVTNRDATLQWVDEYGSELSSGNGVDVSESQTHRVTTTITLRFMSVKSSHAGNYTCKCVVDELSSYETTTYSVSVQRLNTSLNVTASESMPVVAGTTVALMCTAVNEFPDSVEWLDTTGSVISSGDGVNVSLSQIDGVTAVLTLTFTSIMTSQAGNYSCRCGDDILNYRLKIQIPGPTVTVLRDPDFPAQLFTKDTLVLMCIIELIPEVDVPITISSKWKGQSSLTDNDRRVIVSNLEGDQLVYRTSVNFGSLKSSDSGSYTCAATVRPHPDADIVHLFESPVSTDIINVSIVLRVTVDVEYIPPPDFDLPSPPYYRPASSVNLTCRACGATGAVTYKWSSNCTDCLTSTATTQNVTVSVLQANYAGEHTCTAVDSIGNAGSNSTVMNLTGCGLYVAHSQYLENVAVKNNSFIVQKSRSCYYCKVDVYCHCDATLEDVGVYVFPNGREIYSSSNYYYYYVRREGYSGIRIRNYHTYTPSSWGIFTCKMPDSEGNMIENSIGVYHTMPKAPDVYSSDYYDWSDVCSDVFGVVECLTQYSPPTHYTCTRDGVPIDIDGKNYELIQSVIDRRYSKYNNTLLIRNANCLAGNHTYNCTITNDAGSTVCSVDTFLDTQPVVDITTSGEQAIFSKPYTLTCHASLDPKVGCHLIRYLKLDWRRIDGQDISKIGNATTEEQQFCPFSTVTMQDPVCPCSNITMADMVSPCSNTPMEDLVCPCCSVTTLDLVFDPLVMAHGGDYMCEARLVLPDCDDCDDTVSFTTTLDHHINVMNWTIIQLHFSPMLHCVHWYEDKMIAHHLEKDLKHTLVKVINDACNCSFQLTQLTDGEFSCRDSHNSHVTYRVRLEGTSDTLPIPELLEVLKKWMKEDGTFLYTYHAKTRLEVDPNCPLEVATFSQSEFHGHSSDEL